MQFNIRQREITLKVVYYGPPLSGKTTNLQAIHQHIDEQSRGRLMVLDTADDRTLFFDLLPVTFVTASGYRLKLKLFTVPGQVIHTTTRRLVLSGADAVAFIADSQVSEARRNNEFWHGMQKYLKENGIDPLQIPIVIQFNKRDMPLVRTDEEIAQIRKKGREPIYLAVATRGEGVLETLYGLLVLLLGDLNQRYDFAKKFHVEQAEFLSHIFGTKLARQLARQPYLDHHA